MGGMGPSVEIGNGKKNGGFPSHGGTPIAGWSNDWLVVWLPFFEFSHILEIIIPIQLTNIFQRVAQPPTR